MQQILQDGAVALLTWALYVDSECFGCAGAGEGMAGSVPRQQAAEWCIC